MSRSASRNPPTRFNHEQSLDPHRIPRRADSCERLSAPPERRDSGEEAAIARLDWLTDFDAAQARARSENKPLLIDFTGSDWCPPCIRLRKQVFSKLEFADYAAKNLVLLEVDFPKRKTLPPTQQAANDTVARKFGVEGFPTLILLSPERQNPRPTPLHRRQCHRASSQS